MYSVYLLIGSNEGDRLQQLTMAIGLLEKKAGSIINHSSVYETASWGVENLPAHYNQALLLKTRHQPLELLNEIHNIENMLGRERRQKWGLRSIDIDIIYFEDFVINDSRLCVPHPLLQNRKFALVPMVEIAAHHMHPVFLKTNKELLEVCEDTLAVKALTAAITSTIKEPGS